MARVQSEKTRQALLVVGTAMEESPPPERLELFLPGGIPVDVGKDRTRARWRGVWTNVPEQPYEQNDFVMDDDKLYILSDAELLGENDQPSSSLTGAWSIMTISAGMQYFGEWAPGAYRKQSVVTHDDKLWVTPDGIEDAGEFDVRGFITEGNYVASDDITLEVPEATQAGDLLIYAIVVNSFGTWGALNDGVDWTTLLQTPVEETAFPAGRMAVYAKIAEAGDLGDTKTFDNPGSVQCAAVLYSFANVGLPDPDEVDFVLGVHHSFGSPMTLSAGSDPSETNDADKVLRLFGNTAQNYAYDSGTLATFESSSDDQDGFIVDARQLVSLGGYWSEPGASNPPDYYANAGEHKYGAAVRIRLPSPTGFSTDDWDMIGILVDEGAEAAVTEDWHVVGAGGEPAFTNSWDDHASADYKPEFRKRPDNIVEMRGLLISGTTDMSAFTLPVGYRPDGPGNLSFVCMAAAVSTGAPTPVRVDVTPSGEVIPFIAGSAIVWLAIAGIRFSTD